MSSPLFELCPHCDAGRAYPFPQSVVHGGCPACDDRRFVPINLTAAQVERVVREHDELTAELRRRQRTARRVRKAVHDLAILLEDLDP